MVILSDRHITYTLFSLCLAVRILFKFLSGYDNYELFVDAYRYDILSTQILNGNYNLDIVAYLSAPLYSYTLAFIKLLSVDYWQIVAVAFQFFLISLSSVYIYKITLYLFKNKIQGIIAALMYTFYPLTLWLNFTFTQESTFQAYFIFFIYYFLRCTIEKKINQLLLSTFFFSLALLTKSHILILIPFLSIIFFVNKNLKYALLFPLIVFMYTIPHGLVNLKMHDTYTFSSHGNASFFLLGHSDQTYYCLTEQAGELGEFSVYGCDPSFVFDKDYIDPIYGKINQLPVRQRDQVRKEMAFSWIKNNFGKYLDLKLIGIERFLLPGLDRRQYRMSYFVLSLLLGLMIYLPAYFYLYKKLKDNWKEHLLLPSILVIIGAIFIVFFPVNRFRVITLEPLLIVYASCYYLRWIPNTIRSLLSEKH